MPLPYTGNKGESNFEADLVELLTKAGWEKEILKNKTVPELIDNWKNILFERNRRTLNNVPLSDDEMDRVLDVVKLQANTPVKANHFVNGRPLAVKRVWLNRITIRKRGPKRPSLFIFQILGCAGIFQW